MARHTSRLCPTSASRCTRTDPWPRRVTASSAMAERCTLVHFAIDTDIVMMTTRLAGAATHFLPFNKEYDGGAGNPPDGRDRSYRTSYLWEEVLQRDNLLDLFARFLHLQIDEKRDDE